MKDFNNILLDIQKELASKDLDGWLLYDFHRQNDLACQLLQIPRDLLFSRRFLYWIPKTGNPIKIVHAIEESNLDHLPGNKSTYLSWEEWENQFTQTLEGVKKIAMEYSPRNAIPYVSKVDAGTIDIIRDLGVTVVSSADLLQKYTAVWDDEQFHLHLEAADILDQVVEEAWELISKHIKQNKPITEFDVQQFILKQFSEQNCVTEESPICAVNSHSANPHYSPRKDHCAVIKAGDFILIDLWCKLNHPNAPYADITRVGVAAPQPTEKQQKVFEVVKNAREAAFTLIKDRLHSGKALMGWEVDQACRQVIANAGYGDRFLHRTGHNIGIELHGNGANIDNLETRDHRQLLLGTCFSIEPGIYLPGEFGIRLESDVYLHKDGRVQVTGGAQNLIELV